MYEIFRHAYILAQRKLRFAFRLRISKWFDLSVRIDLRKLFKNPCSQAELNKIVPFGFSLQRQKMVFFLPSK